MISITFSKIKKKKQVISVDGRNEQDWHMHACVWLTGHGLEQGSMDKFEVYEILGKETNNKATTS